MAIPDPARAGGGGIKSFEVLFGLGGTPLSVPLLRDSIDSATSDWYPLPPSLGMLPGSPHDHFPKLLTTFV